MNYAEIVDMALSFADREDNEVTSRVDKFIFMAEARINRAFKVGDMSARATIDLTLADTNQRYFALPSDFDGLRSIKIVTGAAEMNLKRLNPEQMTNRVNSQSAGIGGEQIYFNIVAKQIQIFPPNNTGVMEINYYQKVPNLNATDDSNWLSEDNPDCYITAVVAEISAFAKDADAYAIWDGRFKESISEIDLDDQRERWSGTPMEVKVG